MTKAPRSKAPHSSVEIGKRLRIRWFRKAAKMTQTDLAEIMEKDQSTINRWERGVMEFTIGDLLRLADVLGCAPGELIVGGDGLGDDEREMLNYLREHEDDWRIVQSLIETLKTNRQRSVRQEDAA